jgi:hypothetical protein
VHRARRAVTNRARDVVGRLTASLSGRAHSSADSGRWWWEQLLVSVGNRRSRGPGQGVSFGEAPCWRRSCSRWQHLGELAHEALEFSHGARSFGVARWQV